MFRFLQSIIVRLCNVFGGTTSDAESNSRSEENLEDTEEYKKSRYISECYLQMEISELEHLISF